MGIAEQKQKIRAEVLAKLPIRGSLRREYSERIIQSIQSLACWHKLDRIMYFWPTPSEPDLRPLCEESIKKGQLVYLPRCIDREGHMEIVQWNGDRKSLQKDAAGMLAPITGEVITGVSLEMILIPGMAFDKQKGRLGRGVGYYDRFLQKLATVADQSRLLGVTYASRMYETLPLDDHDMKMSMVITEESKF